MSENQKIANRWNEFLIEAQKSPDAFVYILNYVVVLLDQCGKRNNKSFNEMLDVISKIYQEGKYKDFEK